MRADPAARYRRDYDRGWAWLTPLMRIEGREAGLLARLGRRWRLSRGKRLLNRCLQSNPSAWQCMWAIGKAHQGMDQDEAALAWFERAASTPANNPDVFREASIQAAFLGQAAKAEWFASEALRLKPEDAGLHANHAFMLLMKREGERADSAAETACRMSPRDPVNQNILQIVRDVASGRAPWPDRMPKDD